MATPSPEVVLGALEIFPDGAATVAKAQVGGREIGLLVVRCGEVLRAYVDVCPHQFLPLTWRGPRVLSADGQRLRCTSHGAEFAVEDGRGLAGPGSGCALTPVPLRLAEDGTITISG